MGNLQPTERMSWLSNSGYMSTYSGSLWIREEFMYSGRHMDKWREGRRARTGLKLKPASNGQRPPKATWPVSGSREEAGSSKN